MADTVDTILGLTDQETGGNTNTWGDIADANFTKLIRAIATTESIAVTGGTTALSNEQQRSAVILFTGTLASNQVITVSYTKRFIVKNETTGNYTLTVKTAAGTGIQVEQNQTRMLRNDGTNVVDIEIFNRDDIIEDIFKYCGTAGGTADALTGTLNHYRGTDWIAGMSFSAKIASNNTSTTPTFLLSNGLGAAMTGGAKTIVRSDGNALAANELIADDIRTFTYDGTNLRVSGGVLADDSVTTSKIVDANVTAAKLATDAVTTAKIANAAVTLAKIANIANNTFLGNRTGGAAAPEAMTTAQATAILDAMVGDSGSGGTKGLVPAPAAGDAAAAKYLGADGNWGKPGWDTIEKITGTGSRFAPTTVSLSGYDLLRVSIFGIPSQDDGLWFQVGYGGTPTWVAGTAYEWRQAWRHFNHSTGGTNSYTDTESAGTSALILNEGSNIVESASSPGISVEMLIGGLGAGVHTHFNILGIQYMTSSANVLMSWTEGLMLCTDTNAVTAIRAYWSNAATTFTVGGMVVEGMNF